MRRGELAGACAFDVIVGDPPRTPHPVRIIGAAIAGGERLLRPLAERGAPAALVGGALLAAAVVGGTAAAAAACARLGPLARIAGAAAALAARSLDRALCAVDGALAADDLLRAREQLAHIVGRDTAALDVSEVVRAALESGAESLCDGVVAPLLALRLGGLGGAWGYKAANTLDSMIGHPEPPYTYFGRVAARLDDVANLVPARLTVLALALAALVCGEDARGALTVAWRDGPRHRSPNAGWCEAALAGALHVRLGGPNRYAGVLVEGPRFGAQFAPPCAADLVRGIRLVRCATAFAGLAACATAPA